MSNALPEDRSALDQRRLAYVLSESDYTPVPDCARTFVVGVEE
jgi:hypothetical protein